MRYTSLQRWPWILNGTDCPSSRPEKLVSARHWGAAAIVSVTVEPLGTLVAADGLSESTDSARWPAAGTESSAYRNPAPATAASASAAGSPTVFGIATGGGPELTSTRTLEPCRTRVPATGVWAIATPTGACE
jgi:hypothetical protein